MNVAKTVTLVAAIFGWLIFSWVTILAAFFTLPEGGVRVALGVYIVGTIVLFTSTFTYKMVKAIRN